MTNKNDNISLSKFLCFRENQEQEKCKYSRAELG